MTFERLKAALLALHSLSHHLYLVFVKGLIVSRALTRLDEAPLGSRSCLPWLSALLVWTPMTDSLCCQAALRGLFYPNAGWGFIAITDIGMIRMQHQFLLLYILFAQSHLFALSTAQTLIVVQLHDTIVACQGGLVTGRSLAAIRAQTRAQSTSILGCHLLQMVRSRLQAKPWVLKCGTSVSREVILPV